MYKDSGNSVAREKCVPGTEEQEVVEFARLRLGFEPDEQQCEVLRSTAKRGILNCTRQWGKTTVSAAKAVHRAYTRAGSTVVVASPGARQSGEWMRKAEEMLARLGVKKRGDGRNEISLALPNGSRIVGLPEMEAKVRGFSASMLVIDEAARMSDRMYYALLPMLSVSNGDLWMMSTPFGKRGFFYETWEHAGKGGRGEQWHRARVRATDCSRIAKEFLEEQRSVMGAQMFGQEYMCEFPGSGANAFDRDVVEEALDGDVEPMAILNFAAELAHTPKGPPNYLASRMDEMFYVGVDLGKKHDHTAIAIVEKYRDQLLVRGAERIPLGTPYTRVVETVRDVVRSPRLRGRCVLVVDASGVGEPVMELLRKAGLGCQVAAVVITGGGKEGTGSGCTHVPKVNLMTGLQLALEKRTLKIARQMKEAGSLVKELVDIRVKANGGMGAEGAGEHDDLVMAVALACWKSTKGLNNWGGGGFVF